MNSKIWWEGKNPSGEVIRLAAVIGPLVRLLAGLQSGDIETPADEPDGFIIPICTLDDVTGLYHNLCVDELERDEDFVDGELGPRCEPHVTDLMYMRDRELLKAGLVTILTRWNFLLEERGWKVVRRGNSGLDWGLVPIVDSAESAE